MRAKRQWMAVIGLLIVTPAFAAENNGRVRARLTPVVSSLPAVGGTWSSQGPAPILNGSVQNIANRPVVGAIDVVVAHPASAATLWVGSVNGGIWKTTNATSGSPTWTPQTDAAASLAISEITLDPTDATSNTLVAGTGSGSSFWTTGPTGRLLRTTNGGSTWSALSTSLADQSITGIAARGATLVVTTRAGCSSPIYRSTNTGASFSAVSGLPTGEGFDVTGPSNATTTLYAAISDCFAANSGIYKSTNSGATWTRISTSTMNALLNDAVNVIISAGTSNQVFVGIVTAKSSGPGYELSGLFRSGNSGTSWTSLDLPATTDGVTSYGLHPNGQGDLHFSLAADPSNSNLVYVGGDSQGGPSLGGFGGRLFRVNAANASGSQVTSLTHCPDPTAVCFGTQSTFGNTAPHADSRSIAFDANGQLIETDDGGIYLRASPAGVGDWASLNGNLQLAEIHSVAYDGLSNMIFGGTQDNGSVEQTTVAGTTWNAFSGADGGVVGVDDLTRSAQSTRYSGSQYLGLYRRNMNDSGVMMSYAFPQLTVTGGGDALDPQFYTPVVLNQIDPRRILFAGANDLYESLDRGDTVTALGLDQWVVAMAYGGRAGGIDNVDVVYAIAGTHVYVRTSGGGTPVQTATSPGTAFLRDIAVDVTNWNKAYVVNSAGQVFATSNAGATWTNITGNLGSGTNDVWTIAHVPGNPSAIVVGGTNGVFRTTDMANWNQLGSGLSNAIVYDLDYDAFDDTLVAGTLGRGAWKLSPVAVSGTLPALSINDVTVTEGNSGTTNANFTVSLSAASSHTVGVNYATANGTAAVNSATLSNPAAITIPSNANNATPFPSEITVSGLTGTISGITVTLWGFNHTFTQDVDVVLTHPDFSKIVLMSDVGGTTASSGLNLTFDDSAAAHLPASSELSSGTFRPTNVADGDGEDFFSAFAHETLLAAVNGKSPNGTWGLYVNDDFESGDGGSFSGGWSLTITTPGGDYTFKSGTVIFDPGVTSRTISIPVQGDTTAEPNETFLVNLSGASNATVSDSQGQGTITNDDPVPPTNVVAAATSSTNVNISWTAATGAATYRVYRKAAGGSYTQVGETSGTVISDATVAANTAYLYKVRAFAVTESGDSNIDLATTVIFTDPGSLANASFKLAHFTELLTAVNAVRTLAVLGSISFTAPTPATTVTGRAVHVVDLRSGLDAARSALGLSALAYTDPGLGGTTSMKAIHVEELRTGVR
jgi:subtilisin-like proprotein convertase family protein